MICELHPTGHRDDVNRLEFICHRCRRTIWWREKPRRVCSIGPPGSSDYVFQSRGREGTRPVVRSVKHSSPWRALFIHHHAIPNVCGLVRDPAGLVSYRDDRCEYLEFENCSGCGCGNPPAVVSLTFCPMARW